MKNIISVIVCGGSGGRLWPLSRTKQFLCLTVGESLFQQAALRHAVLDDQNNAFASPVTVRSD